MPFEAGVVEGERAIGAERSWFHPAKGYSHRAPREGASLCAACFE